MASKEPKLLPYATLHSTWADMIPIPLFLDTDNHGPIPPRVAGLECEALEYKAHGKTCENLYTTYNQVL